MVKIMNNEKALLVWDNILLEMKEPIIYQSYGFGIKNQDNKQPLFVYNVNEKNEIDIIGFAIELDDSLKIPFGPLTKSTVKYDDIISFIKELSSILKKDVIFCLNDENYNLTNNEFEDVWIFKTPIVDTSVSFDEFLAGCNQNRRRIFRKGLQFYSDECIKEGIEYLDGFYDMYSKRLQETNYPVETDKEYLKSILSLPTTTLKVCKYDNKIVAGAILYTFGDTIITRYNAFDSNYYKHSPISRIDYDNILKACNSSNINNYDFSGLADDLSNSKEQNINRYKDSFGPKKIKTYNWVKYRR